MKYYLLKDKEFEKLLGRIKSFLPDVLRDPRTFFGYTSAPTTMCFGLGDFQGAFILADIVIGLSASVHVYLWDDEIKHQPSVARSIMKQIFMLLRLERLQAQPPEGNIAACKLAESLGFKKEGVLRKIVRYNGELQDLAIYAKLKEE